MITYRNKSLKVHIANTKTSNNSYVCDATRQLAENIRAFVEEGAYSRIVDIIIIRAENDCNQRACIIYQVAREENKP